MSKVSSTADSGSLTHRFRDRMRRQREDHLVRAAAYLLVRRGCRDLRVEEVASACGVAKGTCYQHFRKRPDLIAAAVHRLDDALARRLSSPSPRLKTPRRVLEGAVLAAVDSQILTLTQRAQQAAPTTIEAMDGLAWPCCLDQTPCPHGGAARSMKALRHATTGLATPNGTHAPLLIALLLGVPGYYFSGQGHGTVPTPRTIRASVRQLMGRLFS